MIRSTTGRLSVKYFKYLSNLWTERAGKIYTRQFKLGVEYTLDRLLLCTAPDGTCCCRVAFSLEVDLKT